MSTATATSPRTSRADRNYLSVTPEGCTLWAGTDRAIPAACPTDGEVIAPDAGESCDAVLKLSRLQGGQVAGLLVAQGGENSLDCNSQCRDCQLEGAWGTGGGEGDNVITVKGGCERLTISGFIYSRGRNADVVVGAWSDQCHSKSVDLDFSGLARRDGQPVTFILARCKRVKLPPGTKVLRLRSLGYSCYWWLKFAAVKLGLFR